MGTEIGSWEGKRTNTSGTVGSKNQCINHPFSHPLIRESTDECRPFWQGFKRRWAAIPFHLTPRSKIVTKQISPWGKLVGSDTQLKNIAKTANIETRKITKSIKSCWMGTEIRSLKVTAKGSWDCLPINHCLSHLLAHLSHTHLLGCVRLYVDLWTGVSNPRYFKTWMSPLFELLFPFLPSPSFSLALPSLFFFRHFLFTYF